MLAMVCVHFVHSPTPRYTNCGPRSANSDTVLPRTTLHATAETKLYRTRYDVLSGDEGFFGRAAAADVADDVTSDGTAIVSLFQGGSLF